MGPLRFPKLGSAVFPGQAAGLSPEPMNIGADR
jgi:hypothetical protein